MEKQYKEAVKRAMLSKTDEEYIANIKQAEEYGIILLDRAVENSPYKDMYFVNGKGYQVHYNREGGAGVRRGLSYLINESTVVVDVWNSFLGMNQRGGRTIEKTFDTPAEAVEYVDRQIKRRGKKNAWKR